MNRQQEFHFTNGVAARLLIVVEPDSSEYWIERGASVRILVEGDTALGIEYLPGGMVVYAGGGSQVQLFKDGRRLPQGRKTRHMDTRLLRGRAEVPAQVSPVTIPASAKRAPLVACPAI